MSLQCLPNWLSNKAKPKLTKAESELGIAQPQLVFKLYCNNCIKSMLSQIIDPKQAGAELCQAQVKLEVIVGD